MKLKWRTILLSIFFIVLFLFYGIGKILAQIDVSKPVLNFGAITRPGIKNMSVSITNNSKSPFLGTVDMQEQWLTVNTRDISLASGATRELTFTVDSKSLEPSDYEAKVSFKDLMGASKAELVIKCIVVVGNDDPVMKLCEKTIDFKEVEKGAQPIGHFWVENIGSGVLKIKINYPDWIYGEKEIQLHFTQKRPVYMRAYTSDFYPGEYTDEIKIESNGGNESIAVLLKIKPRPDDPIISFEPKEIDFGTVKKGKKGRKNLKILNKGKGRLSGTITYPEWIEGQEEFKDVEKIQSYLLVADPGKLPYGITKDVIKLTSDAGMLDVPVKIYVEKR